MDSDTKMGVYYLLVLLRLMLTRSQANNYLCEKQASLLK